MGRRKTVNMGAGYFKKHPNVPFDPLPIPRQRNEYEPTGEQVRRLLRENVARLRAMREEGAP